MKSKRHKGRIASWASRRSWFRRLLKSDPDPLTLLVMTKGQNEVQKVHLSPRLLRFLKLSIAGSLFFVVICTAFFIHFLAKLPEHLALKAENVALKEEIQDVQFYLDSLQTTIDRIGRFHQKLRNLTEVDKEFAKNRGPLGQGGGDFTGDLGEEVYHFGDFQVEESNLSLHDRSAEVLERRDRFTIQKAYAQMQRLFRDSELEAQSVEELFEVVKGREFRLAATPSIQPVRGWVTSHFGHRRDPFSGRRTFHRGMDIAARKGTPILAPAEGVVSFAGPYGTFGNTVILMHGYGISTLYAHAEDVLVRTGQRVDRGDILGTVGKSGRTTGSHVHYEVKRHGVHVDPREYILTKRASY